MNSVQFKVFRFGSSPGVFLEISFVRRMYLLVEFKPLYFQGVLNNVLICCDDSLNFVEFNEQMHVFISNSKF